MPEENQPEDYGRRLEEARRRARPQDKNQKVQKDIENLAKSATPWGFLGLITQISPASDWMYGLALFAAVFKDILDFLEASGVLYFVIIILTICVSIFIGFMMLLGSFSTRSGRIQQKMLKSYLILIGGTTVEMLFGINFLPIETLTVLLVYALTLSSRKQGKEEEKKSSEMDAAQESYA